MTKGVQFRRGDSASHNNFTGREGELTVNTEKKIVVVHDGFVQGGYELVGVAVTQQLSNKTFSGVTTFANAVVTGVTTLTNVSVSGALTATTLNSTTGIVTNFRVTGISTFDGSIFESNSNSAAAVRITQTGTANALVVEDATNPDGTPFVIDSVGSVGIGTLTSAYKLSVAGTGAIPTSGLTGALADFTGTSTQYMQVNIRNTDGTSSTASADLVVTANDGTNETRYIDLGINNSAFTETADYWTINGGGDAYLYSNNVNLAIGCTGTGDRLSLFAGSLLSSAEKVSVTATGVGVGTTIPSAKLTIGVGTATHPAVKFLSDGSALLTDVQAGAVEYDGNALYLTNNLTQGRSQVLNENYFKLNADRGALSLVGAAYTNFFGNSIPLVAGASYELETNLYFTKGTTAGLSSVRLSTHGGSPTNLAYFAVASPIAGATNTLTAALYAGAVGVSATTVTITLGSLAAAAQNCCIKIVLDNNTATAFSVSIASTVATITPNRGSYWKIRRLPSAVGVGSTGIPNP